MTDKLHLEESDPVYTEEYIAGYQQAVDEIVKALRDVWKPGAWRSNYHTVNGAADFVARTFGQGEA